MPVRLVRNLQRRDRPGIAPGSLLTPCGDLKNKYESVLDQHGKSWIAKRNEPKCPGRYLPAPGQGVRMVKKCLASLRGSFVFGADLFDVRLVPSRGQTRGR